ncbi:ATP-sensitive inward rectifier potassium channel 10 [Komarekiella sp. 'clone 1']|uniref:ATP-sensitive inward rectifier potassium channel 10 n=1 Tax=Komarekiella delphini-convector SJRDD-AB1 TaxID=2593771 RepID=A0AA40VR00_9NOST|nr:ion channel [Komarekiella delphini-convector]MBD6616620.1 ATP-sensitive inward rectifier potassium channel 10 [Komarekiella delphini-convector SJRDD-AB1]
MKFRLKRLSQKQRQRLIPRIHIKIQDGQFEIMGMGVWYSYWRDPYHLLLTIPWTAFLALIAVLYVGINALFALAYLAGGDCIENARPGYFLDAFFFSVQTLASIGYGAMYPKTTYANTIVTIEAMAGLVGIAVMTGLAFARFSRPTARVLFSRVAVITPHEGVPTLMFRAANERRNQILEAQMRVYLMRDEVTVEGHLIRRFHDLKLLRSQTPSFMLSWSAMHPIDEYSPLYGMTSESLIQTKTTLVISLSGIDETVAQVVHARHHYSANDILWNYRFVDIIHYTGEGHRYIDYNHFHDILPLD